MPGSEHRRVSCVVPTPERPLFEQGVCAACNTLWPCEVARLQALLAERDAEIALLVAAGNKMHEGGKALRTYVVRDKTKNLKGAAWGDNLEFGLEASTTLCEGMEQWRAALAARGAQR